MLSHQRLLDLNVLILWSSFTATCVYMMYEKNLIIAKTLNLTINRKLQNHRYLHRHLMSLAKMVLKNPVKPLTRNKRHESPLVHIQSMKFQIILSSIITK